MGQYWLRQRPAPWKLHAIAWSSITDWISDTQLILRPVSEELTNITSRKMCPKNTQKSTNILSEDQRVKIFLCSTPKWVPRPPDLICHVQLSFTRRQVSCVISRLVSKELVFSQVSNVSTQRIYCRALLYCTSVHAKYILRYSLVMQKWGICLEAHVNVDKTVTTNCVSCWKYGKYYSWVKVISTSYKSLLVFSLHILASHYDTSAGVTLWRNLCEIRWYIALTGSKTWAAVERNSLLLHMHAGS